MNPRAYRTTEPAPLTADEMRRAHLYAVVMQLDTEAAQHRRHARFSEVDRCRDAADAAQAEIEALYLP